jgi:tyrosine-protein phosphatase
MGRLGIKAVLNVAKEVASPFEEGNHAEMSYLKMNWSHGQTDLIKEGFPAAMAFVDDAQGRGEGVLIQSVSSDCDRCISLIPRVQLSMRHFSLGHDGHRTRHASRCKLFSRGAGRGARPEGHACRLCLCQKEESLGWPEYVVRVSAAGPAASISPTASSRLIYQLLEYEKTFNSEATSPTESDRASSIAEDEAEWSKRRAALDEMSEDDDERESLAIRREAEALDKAMEDRLLARKASNSSIGSAGVVGAVPAWKQRYGQRRRRMGSLASMTSIRSSSSVLSENLVEEDEEAELLGLGSANENRSMGGSRSPSIAPEESPLDPPSEPAPLTARPAAMRFAAPPMSAAPTKTSFSIPPPPMSAAPTRTSFNIPPSPITAIRASFDLDSTPRPRTKRRPAPLVNMLPPVPSSPDVPEAVEEAQAAGAPASLPAEPSPVAAVAPPPLRRTRTEAGRPTPPPLYLRTAPKGSRLSSVPPSSGPSQTLFVFPPSPKDRDTASQSRTPAAMTLMSHLQQVPFPSVASPRVASFQKAGRMRSYVALGVPATPTTACSLVDARGWFGADA